MTTVIQTKGLSKSYGNVDALKPVDLTVSRHAIFGFLGPNGAGKTTLMKLLLGLIQPTSGSAAIFGKDIVKDSVEIRSRVGYLPQEPRFYEFMTARQTLDFTARFFFSGPQHAIDKRVNEMLGLVGLSDKADRPIKGFSGGERQRLGIAQAQVNYPELLILDEPAAALDPLGRRDVLNIMERLREHATIFYSTHILDDVQQVSDTVAILNQGELAAHGNINTLLNGGQHTVYTMDVQGDVARAKEIATSQPWVVRVEAAPQGTATNMLVTVSDETAANTQLLRLLMADEQLVVSNYGRKTVELEDIFVNIVEGGENDSK
ncbi:ABC transporter ATP-binding protein [Candidatus Leptofilum sp.]|uniref:ABC transporter ATP-binding protein n=1 Tax=Candidatus Leptofilum sp. TaxID=3241576 RepID=UPI003B5957C5